MDKGEWQNKSVFQKNKGMYWEFSHLRTGAHGTRQLLHWPHAGNCHPTGIGKVEDLHYPSHMTTAMEKHVLASRVMSQRHVPNVMAL